MKQRTVFTWDKDDQSLTFVEEALNRLENFKRPDDLHGPKGCNKVLNNCDFTNEDVAATCGYLLILADRARQRWGPGTELASNVQMAESIMQAAENAEQVSKQLQDLFSEKLMETVPARAFGS